MANNDFFDDLFPPKTPEKQKSKTQGQSPSPGTKKRQKEKERAKVYRSKKRKREDDSKKNLTAAGTRIYDLECRLTEQQAENAALKRAKEVPPHSCLSENLKLGRRQRRAIEICVKW